MNPRPPPEQSHKSKDVEGACGIAHEKFHREEIQDDPEGAAETVFRPSPFSPSVIHLDLGNSGSSMEGHSRNEAVHLAI